MEQIGQSVRAWKTEKSNLDPTTVGCGGGGMDMCSAGCTLVQHFVSFRVHMLENQQCAPGRFCKYWPAWSSRHRHEGMDVMAGTRTG